MSGRSFIDTNVFIYADDADEPAKQAVAKQVIRELSTDGRGVVSTQVLMEYVSVARKKLGLSLAECRPAVLLMRRFDVVLTTPEQVLGALDLASTYSLSSWDGLIVKAASAAGCGRLVTEDLQHGRTIDGVRIENPFAAI